MSARLFMKGHQDSQSEALHWGAVPGDEDFDRHGSVPSPGDRKEGSSVGGWSLAPQSQLGCPEAKTPLR
jgi:hypothetical protein